MEFNSCTDELGRERYEVAELRVLKKDVLSDVLPKKKKIRCHLFESIEYRTINRTIHLLLVRS